MAREERGNWLQQHVEKIVLGATVVLLAVMASHWVISSPRDVEGVPPDRIDLAQRERAEKVVKRHQAGRPRQWQPPEGVPKLEACMTDPVPPFGPMDELTQAPPVLPVPKEVFHLEEGPALADLMRSVPAPSRPLAWVGYELPLPSEGEGLEDRFVAHVACVLDVGKIDTGWRATLVGSRIAPYVAFCAVEAEVQEMGPDGTWGPARPAKMRVPEPPANEDGEPVVVPEIPEFDGTNSDDIQAAIAVLRGPDLQRHVLQPRYPNIYLPDHGWVTWLTHLPETQVSIAARKLLEEQEQRPGKAPPARTIRRRTPGAPSPPRVAPRRPPIERRRPTAEKIIRPPMTSGRAPIGPGRTLRRPGKPPAERGPAGTLSKESARERHDGRQGPEELSQPIVPPLIAQLRSGKVIVWFHDTSLKSGRAYRYRMRMILVNPLYTHEADVKKGCEKDARIAKLATPWSPWSRRRRVSNTTEFYVSGHAAAGRRKTVNVEVFTRSLGQQVMRRFSVRRGGVIGRTASVEVVDPLEETVVVKEVDFSTGAIAVSFDFRRRIYKGKSQDPAYTTAMVYLDPRGRLGVRTGYEDGASERYAELRRQAQRTADAVKQAKAGGGGGELE